MTDRKTVYVGADHAGYTLKTSLLLLLTKEFPNLNFKDLGCDSDKSVDYPDFAAKVGREVAGNPGTLGILICGSGLGMCIAANKISGVRATSAWDATSARLSRLHNDSNIVCLGARLLGTETALEAARVWLTTWFEGNRHQKRIDLIKKLEETK